VHSPCASAPFLCYGSFRLLRARTQQELLHFLCAVSRAMDFLTLTTLATLCPPAACEAFPPSSVPTPHSSYPPHAQMGGGNWC